MSEVKDKWRGPRPGHPEEDWALKWDPLAKKWSARLWTRRHLPQSITADHVSGEWLEFRTEDGFYRFPRAQVRCDASQINHAGTSSAAVGRLRLESPYHDRRHSEYVADSWKIDLSIGTGIWSESLRRPQEWRVWHDPISGRFCAIRLEESVSPGIVRARAIWANNTVFSSHERFLVFRDCEAKVGHESFLLSTAQDVEVVRIMPPTQNIPLPSISIRGAAKIY